MAISDYSTTAASNTSISGIDISGVTGKVKDGDNAIRQMMADIKAGVPYLSGTTYLIESTDAGATAGPDFATYRNSASPAASDLIGRYLFQGEDSAGNTETYAAIAGRISDPTSTSEDAALLVQAALAGTLTTYIYVGANAAGTATANAVGLPLGQLSFPATQNASSDANTLDDYKEFTFTITAAFATPGNSSWAYTTQSGRGVKTGKGVYWSMNFAATPTIGTGSGVVSFSGLPYNSETSMVSGSLEISGTAWTWPASRGMVVPRFASGTGAMTMRASGTGLASIDFQASNMSSGNLHTLLASGYLEASA